MRNYRDIILLFILIALHISALAQEGFTMEGYLKTAYMDQSLERYHAQIDFLDNNNFNTPWLNRVEVRIGSEDANISLNEYRLRLSAANPAEVRANKIYHQKQLNSLNSDYEIAINDALKNRYQLLIEHYYYSGLHQIYEQNSNLFSELIRNINPLGNQNFDAEDIIDIESDVSDLLIKKEEIELEISEIGYLMSLDLPSANHITWDSLAVVDAQTIKEYIESESDGENNEYNIYIKESEDDLVLNEQLLKINKAEARSNIGYLQGNFDTERGDNIEEHLGFQVGVRIPIVNPDKADINRDRFELIEDQKEVDETKSLIQRRTDVLLIRLHHLFDQYDLVTERISRSNQIIVNGSSKGPDIFNIIKKAKYQMDLHEKQFDIQKDIYEAFIDYLDIRGELVKKPVVNYLSVDLTTLVE